jgi:hypothetical protein
MFIEIYVYPLIFMLIVNVSLWITRREWIASVYLDPQLKKNKRVGKIRVKYGVKHHFLLYKRRVKR